jgi:hypothetical protein
MVDSIIVDSQGRGWLRWHIAKDGFRRSYLGHVSDIELRDYARDFCLEWNPFAKADRDGQIIVATAQGRAPHAVSG